MRILPLLQWLALLSAITFVLGLFLAPVVVARMPQDHFLRSGVRQPPRAPVMALVRMVIGSLLVAAGVLMLVLPGQGILTILLGLVLMGGARVRRLELWIVRRARLLPVLNRIRRWADEPPFELPYEGIRARGQAPPPPPSRDADAAE